MTPSRKKPGVAFWATVVVVSLPLLYVLSFGPVCWWLLEPDQELNEWQTSAMAPTVYEPIGWLHHRIPSWLADAFDAYITLGMREGDIIHIPDTAGGVVWQRPIE
jgi:hypothetical protein